MGVDCCGFRLVEFVYLRGKFVAVKACSRFICFESELEEKEDPEKIEKLDEAFFPYFSGVLICLLIALLTGLYCDSSLGFPLDRE